jgi:hypothetical protein
LESPRPRPAAVALRLAAVALLLGSVLAPHGVAHPLSPLLPGGAKAVPSMPVDPAGVLPRLPWEAPGTLVRVESGTPWLPLLFDGRAAAPGDPNSPFWCPGLDGTPSVTDTTNTMTIRATCPYRIIDDADLLGSPQIAVHANDPNAVAFFSLHGGGSTQGPTPRSRDPSPDGAVTLTGLSHTTFTSQDHGRSWHDNPWGTDGFGEHAAGTMDADGNLYIAALWSKRLGDGHFDYVIKLYKEQDSRYTISTYQPSKTFANRAAGNEIDQVNIVYLPAPPPPVPDNATGNTSANNTRPADQGEVGNSTLPGDYYGVANSADDRVMAVWFERALDWRNSTTGKSSWIDAAWTDTSARDNWTRLDDSRLIGPCMAASNPVVYHGKAYVACVADAGYNGRSRARIGDIDVWSIDPHTGKTDLVESTGLQGGQPRMAGRADGYMAIASSTLRGDEEVDVQIGFGWYGRHWTAPANLGGDLHRLTGNHPALAARVTAMALTEDRNVLYLSYMERVNRTARAPDPNPSALNTDPRQAIEYNKVLVSLTQCGTRPIDAYDLQTGVARHPFMDGTIGDSTGVFDDLQDGMQFWKDPATGAERVYFAYGDHGVIQFGALLPTQGGEPCPVLAPPPTLPVPPVPAALSTASPYSMLVGATVGATALAMVTYLLAAKRRTATYSTAKDKRK